MIKERYITDFYQSDVPAYAAYDNIRKIASYIDGFKNSQRKVVFTMLKKYPKDFVKTETLSNVCAAYTNYLHGAANLAGVIANLTQKFIGTNNYPLLNGNDGGFGNRIGDGRPAAPRYTRNALNQLTRNLLNTKDDSIIGQQFFEGEYIEPSFFMPIFPILFLNGSSGLSTGFSQDIYPRNPIEVIEYIKKKISGTEHPRMALLPWFRGHLGKVEVNKETKSVESFGVITKNNMTSYTITELPIGIEYQKYIEFLDKLCENGTIQDYEDKCDPKTDKILFELKTTRDFTKKHEDRKLYDVLHLVKSLPETLNCIDENNRVKEFNSIQEILDSFIAIRLEFYNKRKAYLLKSFNDDLAQLNSKYQFCKGIIDKTIVVANVKKTNIISQLESNKHIVQIDNSYDYLLNMPMHSVSIETLDELKKKISLKTIELNDVKSKTIETMWLDDLHELRKHLS